MTEIKYKTLDNYLKGLETKGFSPVYLIYGEELLYKTAFEALLEALLPAAKQNLNYEPIDGDDENIIDAIEKVNTYSLLPGTKVVAIYDSKIFYSKQDESRLLEKAKEAFEAQDIKKAAKYFLSLLGLMNLAFDDVGRENRSQTLKLDDDSLSDDKWLDKILSYCMENSLSIPSGADKAGLLQKAVDKGFPKGNHLIITTDIVDKRRKLYKTIRENGVIIDCSVPKGNLRADRLVQEAVLNERMSAILNQFQKTIDKGAFRAMYEMTGFDLHTFSNNLQKLVNYVGDRKNITADDVESVLKRTKKDPIYEFTNAVSDRNVVRSLFFMDSLLAENLHPLQILAAMTNQIRKLLLVKGFVESAHGSSWHAGLHFNQFKNKIMPAILAYDRDLLNQLETWDGMLLKDEHKDNHRPKKKATKQRSKPVTDLVIAKAPKNPYPVYQILLKSELFTTDELIAVLETLSQADLRLKSTGQNPKLILEEVIFRIA